MPDNDEPSRRPPRGVAPPFGAPGGTPRAPLRPAPPAGRPAAPFQAPRVPPKVGSTAAPSAPSSSSPRPAPLAPRPFAPPMGGRPAAAAAPAAPPKAAAPTPPAVAPADKYSPPLEPPSEAPPTVARAVDGELATEASAEHPVAPPSHPDSTLGWTFEYSALPALGPSADHHAPEGSAGVADAPRAEAASYLADEGVAAPAAAESPYRDEGAAPLSDVDGGTATIESGTASTVADYAPDAWGGTSGSSEGEMAATTLESIARRVRAGEVRPSGLQSGMSDEAVLAAVLAALLGVRG